MSNRFRITVLGLISLLVSACTSDLNKDFYNDTSPGTASSPGLVRIAILDQRPYVLSGEKKASFIGKFKLRLGKPYDGFTESGEPLAKAFGNTASSILSNQYQQYQLVDLAADQKHSEQALQAMLSQPAERYVLMTINEWYSKTATDTDLKYALSLNVYNQHGELLAQTKTSGNDVFGGSPIAGPITNSGTSMEHAFRQKLNNLIDDPAIHRALTEKDVKPVPPRQEEAILPATTEQPITGETEDNGHACTVQQILTMKNNGLSDEIILTRCTSVAD